eukprot:scaffold4236_cov122-Skeletonema_marinoi.AAC.3
MSPLPLPLLILISSFYYHNHISLVTVTAIFIVTVTKRKCRLNGYRIPGMSSRNGKGAALCVLCVELRAGDRRSGRTSTTVFWIV